MARGDLQTQDLRVIMLLASARTPLTTKQIGEKLGLELRTVQRIIKAIEAIPLPLKRDTNGMGGGIRLAGDFSLKVSLPSNLVELAAVTIARDGLRESAGGTLIGEAFEQLTDRILSQLKGEQREICDRFVKMYRTKAPAEPAHASPVARDVHRALDEHKVITIEYVSPGAAVAQRRELEPYGVWMGNGRTYVVGRDRKKDALRTFALDRIRSATLTETPFEPPAGFDPSEYFAHSLGAFVGSGPLDVTLELDREAVRRLGGKLPSKDAQLTTRANGSARMRWNVPLSDELLAWMVTLGPGVDVTAPPAAVDFVRDGFAARATRALKRRAG